MILYYPFRDKKAACRCVQGEIILLFSTFLFPILIEMQFSTHTHIFWKNPKNRFFKTYKPRNMNLYNPIYPLSLAAVVMVRYGVQF